MRIARRTNAGLRRALDDAGATVIEYALLVAAVGLVGFLGFIALSGTLQSAYNSTAAGAGVVSTPSAVPTTTPLTLTGYAPITGYVGVPIAAQTPTPSGVTGVPVYSVAIGSPALPSGLVLDPGTGTLTGTPDAPYTPPQGVVIQIRDGSASANQTVLMVVYPAVSISGYSDIVGVVGTAIPNDDPNVTGGTPGFTFSIAPSLPPGLSLDGTTGRISGNPTAFSGDQQYTVTVVDSVGASASTTLHIRVTLPNPLTFATPYTNISVQVGTTITPQTPGVTGGTTPYTFAISPAEPAGMAFNTGTGRISGTPSAVQLAKTYTVTVTDSAVPANTSSTTFTITVTAAPVALSFATGYTPIVGVVGTAITPQTPSVTGGTTPYAFTISPALSAGLTISPTTGAISGTPTAAKALTAYVVTVTDSVGGTATANVNITVNAAPTPPSFTTGYTAIVGQVGTPITAQTPVVTGGTGGNVFTIAPALPAGLSINASNGQISGTPTAVQAVTAYVVTVTDSSNATATANLNVTITAGKPDAPVLVSVVSTTNNQATLTWTAPSTGGSPITGYFIEYKTSTQAWTAASSTTVGAVLTTTITGLNVNGATYNFRVSARNAIGTGVPSNEMSVVP